MLFSDLRLIISVHTPEAPHDVHGNPYGMLSALPVFFKSDVEMPVQPFKLITFQRQEKSENHYLLLSPRIESYPGETLRSFHI